VRHGGERVGIGVEAEGRAPDVHGGVKMKIQTVSTKLAGGREEHVEIEPVRIGNEASRR
jgi:hypothetical protein